MIKKIFKIAISAMLILLMLFSITSCELLDELLNSFEEEESYEVKVLNEVKARVELAMK